MATQAATGRVLRVLGGFYTVALPDGAECQCRLAGRMKSGGGAGSSGPVLPGDLVSIADGEDTILISAVLPRQTELVRPAIANVDICVVVQSFVHPRPVLELLEKILLMSASRGIEPLLCWTKADLVTPEEQQPLVSMYERAGYESCITSAVTGQGLDELRASLSGRVSILSGASGVGKSSLLNVLHPGGNFKTAEISSRAARGRQTTRHTQLLPVAGAGWVADSPGFSALDLAFVGTDAVRLGCCYPDFAQLAQSCRFADCRHHNEPGCAVKTAVTQGIIDCGRYERYLRFLEEVEVNAARQY